MLEPQSVETAANSPTDTQRVELRAAEIQAWLVTSSPGWCGSQPMRSIPNSRSSATASARCKGSSLQREWKTGSASRSLRRSSGTTRTLELLARHLAEDPEGVAAAADFQMDD